MNNEIVITTAKNDDREGIKSLWKTVFGDTEQYIDLFLEQRFEPSQCVVAKSGQAVTAMLFMLPFILKQPDGEYRGRYIYAVATHPDFRSRGISTKLLDFAHDKAIAEGAALSALVPASESLFNYYAVRGFKTEFYKREELFSCVGEGNCELTAVRLEEMLTLRRKNFEKSSAFVDWDSGALYHQQNENELLGGDTLYFEKPEKGYALCLPTDEGVFIREWCCNELYPDVMAAIANRYNAKTVKVRLAADKDEVGALPFAMTKWYISERKAQRGAPAMISLVLD